MSTTRHRYRVDPSGAMKFSDVAYGATNASDIVQDALDSMKITVLITIGGVTMHAAAWEDPDHWATDWVEAQSLEGDEEDVVLAEECIDAALERGREAS